MKRVLLVVVMLLVAGTAAYALPASNTGAAAKRVECKLSNGKIKLVKTVDACKSLGGTVVEAKKVA